MAWGGEKSEELVRKCAEFDLAGRFVEQSDMQDHYSVVELNGLKPESPKTLRQDEMMPILQNQPGFVPLVLYEKEGIQVHYDVYKVPIDRIPPKTGDDS